MMAAQLFAAAAAELGDLDASFARGDFSALLTWLRAKVYRVGSLRSAQQTLVALTGEPLTPRPLVEYLTRKFEELYGL
jgi:carboxypeptidase Taq